MPYRLADYGRPLLGAGDSPSPARAIRITSRVIASGRQPAEAIYTPRAPAGLTWPAAHALRLQGPWRRWRLPWGVDGRGGPARMLR